MVLPLISGRAPTSSAAATAAPEEMPTGMPSSRATARAVSKAASLLTVTTSSITERSRIAGTNPAPMPWILCGPGWPPDSTGESSGSTATIRSDGLRGFSTWPTPVMVPPVPTPATNTSMLAVGVVPDLLGGGAAMDFRVGRVVELLRDDRARDLAARAPRALAMAPRMPCGPAVSTSSAPSRASILRRSIDIVSGMTRISR